MNMPEESKLPLVKYLLDHSASMEFHNRKGYTALYDACEHGCPTIVRLLLSYGGSISGAFTFNEETGWSIAAFKLVEHIRGLLEAKNQRMDIVAALKCPYDFEVVPSYYISLPLPPSYFLHWTSLLPFLIHLYP